MKFINLLMAVSMTTDPSRREFELYETLLDMDPDARTAHLSKLRVEFMNNPGKQPVEKRIWT